MADTLIQNITQETLSITTGETVILEGLPVVVSPAPGGGDPIVVSWSYGDASPALLTTIAAGKRVYTAEMIVETGMDGTGAALSIGRTVSVNEILATTENTPSVAAVYETTPTQKYAESTQLFLYITPGSGASAGAGQVRLFIEA